ncbi:propionyl-CoA carboxylase beta chain [Meredithblackwellia eburnea MCA 4105]
MGVQTTDIHGIESSGRKVPSHLYNYPVLPSTTSTTNDKAQANKTAMLDLVRQLDENLLWATGQGKGKYQKQHLGRGMLLARDRISMLLDEGSPFLELCALAGFGWDDSTPSASSVAGIGLVCGTLTLITANVPTLDGGSTNEATVWKGERLGQIGFENRLPNIALVQSAGANLPQQFRVFHRGGGSFRDLAQKSQARIPTCAVVFGSSTAGGAYQPGMSDCVIMVKNQAQVFLGGPPLVKMATGEVATAEELGGADMHSRISGVSDQLAQDEFDAVLKAREWIASLNWPGPSLPRTVNLPVMNPLYPSEEILSIAMADVRQPWEVRELIARIVDGSRFIEFKPLYGPGLVLGWAYIHGFPVGIIANNAVLFPPESNKATQFIRLCNTRNVPIVFLQNITGFMVGRRFEEAGIIKSGSLFINAVSNSTVPHLTIMCGSSFGAGNYAMSGRAYNPRFLFSWPNSKCSVMGTEQLAGVMDEVARDGARRSGKPLNEKVHQARIDALKANVEETATVWYTSSRMLDDGVIDPRDTRTVLAFCLNVVHGAPVQGNPGFAGISRM